MRWVPSGPGFACQSSSNFCCQPAIRVVVDGETPRAAAPLVAVPQPARTTRQPTVKRAAGRLIVRLVRNDPFTTRMPDTSVTQDLPRSGDTFSCTLRRFQD